MEIDGLIREMIGVDMLRDLCIDTVVTTGIVLVVFVTFVPMRASLEDPLRFC